MNAFWGLALVMGVASASAEQVPTAPQEPEPHIREVDQVIEELSETVVLTDCGEDEATSCAVNVFVVPDEKPKCLYTALVSDAVVRGDGSTAYAHLIPLVLASRDRIGDGEERRIVYDKENASVTAAVFFEESGFQDICFARRFRSKERLFELFRAAPLNADGKPIKVDERLVNSSSGMKGALGGLLGGIFGNTKNLANASMLGSVTGTRTKPRIGFFEGAYQRLQAGLGCALTGCPEKLAISVTVRGGEKVLPILENGARTRFSTDATLMVPRGKLGTLAVEFSDGKTRALTDCDKVQETSVSATFQCAI